MREIARRVVTAFLGKTMAGELFGRRIFVDFAFIRVPKDMLSEVKPVASKIKKLGSEVEIIPDLKRLLEECNLSEEERKLIENLDTRVLSNIDDEDIKALKIWLKCNEKFVKELVKRASHELRRSRLRA